MNVTTSIGKDEKEKEKSQAHIHIYNIGRGDEKKQQQQKAKDKVFYKSFNIYYLILNWHGHMMLLKQQLIVASSLPPYNINMYTCAPHTHTHTPHSFSRHCELGEPNNIDEDHGHVFFLTKL